MKIFTIAAVLFLAGCGAAYQRQMACYSEAGQKPDAGLNLFGLVGEAIADQDPDRQAWNARVHACMVR